MKAITTRYHGASDTRGSRIIASDGDGNRCTVGYEYAADAQDNHAIAARALCAKLDWAGTLHGGWTRPGEWVWVFANQDATFSVVKRADYLGAFATS